MYPYFNRKDDEKMSDLAVLTPSIQYNTDRYTTSILIIHGGTPGQPFQKAVLWLKDTLPNVVGFQLLDVSSIGVLTSGPTILTTFYVISERLASETNGGWSSVDGVREPIIGMLSGVPNQDTFPDQRFPNFWYRNPTNIHEIDLELKSDSEPIYKDEGGRVTFTLQIFHALTS